MRWALRRAVPTDAAALSLVAQATFLEAFAAHLSGTDIVAHCAAKSDAATFARWAGDGRNVVMLAEGGPGAAPVGYSVLTMPDLPVETTPGDIELRRIYTLQSLHGSGLGAALMDGAFADARDAGAHRLLLGVYGGNERARRFYENQGFAVVGTRRFLVGTTWCDDFIYARDL